ncbi:unnamed protein product [Polarella glacialis]|uniref:Uncharacterized protein n=1 Tax=Polarella glacialis TaxID=89957 RepID=A0A813KJJ5_POLGL|nr:unnamed protein product [Polarella glacialis]
MPFASGPRGCIGKEFSFMEQKIVAVKLLQRFTMRSPKTWTAREGSVLTVLFLLLLLLWLLLLLLLLLVLLLLLFLSWLLLESLPHTILGIDAEFSPQQFFAGASIPVQLQLRPTPCSRDCSSGSHPTAAVHSHGGCMIESRASFARFSSCTLLPHGVQMPP